MFALNKQLPELMEKRLVSKTEKKIILKKNPLKFRKKLQQKNNNKKSSTLKKKK